jgi:hypothetical protein
VGVCVPLHTQELPGSIAWVGKDELLYFGSIDPCTRMQWHSLGVHPSPFSSLSSCPPSPLSPLPPLSPCSPSTITLLEAFSKGSYENPTIK